MIQWVRVDCATPDCDTYIGGIPGPLLYPLPPIYCSRCLTMLHHFCLSADVSPKSDFMCALHHAMGYASTLLRLDNIDLSMYHEGESDA